MQRKRWIVPLVLGICVSALMAWILGVAARPASGQLKTLAAVRTAAITVTAGKPTELGFMFSKASNLPTGSLTFKVTNLGLGFHDFKICTTPVTSAAKNTCVGKATPILKSHQSATLTLTLTKAGKYEFLCTVPGHAAAGMKGLIGVGVSVPKSAAVVGTPSAVPAATTKAGGGTTTTVANTTTTTATPTPAPAPTPAPNPTPTPTPVPTGGGTGPDGCPAGQTIVTAGGNDHDEDDGGAASDGDGCI